MFYISKPDWKKVIGYSKIAWDKHKAEIGGMLIAEPMEAEDGTKYWQMKDPVILKQEITAGNTHLDKDALAEYYTKVADKYKPGFKFVWWHSHHTMQAFFSGTDEDTIQENSDSDFSFALVVNLKEEYKFRVSIWKMFPTQIDYEITIVDTFELDNELMEKEVEELCSTTVVNYKQTYGGWSKTSYVDKSVKGNDWYHNQLNAFDPDDVMWDSKAWDEIDDLNWKFMQGAIKKTSTYKKKLFKLNNKYPNYTIELPDEAKEIEDPLELNTFLSVASPSDFITMEVN
jgi:proteasome lid subunit RPN8/RPN11